MSETLNEGGRATWGDLVARIFGPVSDEEADMLLWEATAFPFARPLYIARQLRKLRSASGGDVGRALAIASAELETAMRDSAGPS